MIRRANKNDLPILIDLWHEMSVYHQNLDSYFTLVENAKAAYSSFLEGLLAKDNVAIFLFEKDGVAAGSIMAKTEFRPPVFPKALTGFIQEVSVHTRYQRQGIGEQLVREAFLWLKDQGVHEVSCNYSPANPKSAAFWQKLGFSVKTVTAMLKI